MTPHTSPLVASYGVSIVRILETTEHFITALPCISILWQPQNSSYEATMKSIDKWIPLIYYDDVTFKEKTNKKRPHFLWHIFKLNN